ncbi:MAG: hypothetical protein PQJ58_09580 [Spirochaetales bacterium]|nr:hypothetical protein [Spirochaetales bacterium]
MRYQFEYFYIYKGKLLLGETIDSMEELLELAAIEKSLEAPEVKSPNLYSESSPRAASSSR